ncbi:hypothetical protein ACFQFH_17805 [Halobaculum halobium]|uniref:hypothetical protein n=1 Tax=Halobaculum halobium TaxID=3032281 RepID=UPI003620FD25
MTRGGTHDSEAIRATLRAFASGRSRAVPRSDPADRSIAADRAFVAHAEAAMESVERAVAFVESDGLDRLRDVARTTGSEPVTATSKSARAAVAARARAVLDIVDRYRARTAPRLPRRRWTPQVR